jgi:hypothetical protein
MIAIAVKLLVIEAIRKTLSASTGVCARQRVTHAEAVREDQVAIHDDAIRDAGNMLAFGIAAEDGLQVDTGLQQRYVSH